MPNDADEQLRQLCENAAEVVSTEELRTKLAAGRPLRVKLGIDATADDVHIGFSVPLRKLRRFQDLGHIAVLIVGDFTARIGDPSGQDKTRPMLSKDEVDAHTARLLEQFRLILRDDRLDVRRNSEWLEPMGVEGLLALASHQTVAQVLQRDDFAKRFAARAPITIRELAYPLLQGYDSVAVGADVELGGTDQHFNLLVGRQVQRAHNQEPQVVMTMPLIEGTDGARKMSKSLGNYIGITESADEMFGKLMRVPDELIEKYLTLTTDVSHEERERLLEQPPQVAKRGLASEIVKLYHGEEEAAAASDRFDKVFVRHELPDDMPTHALADGDGAIYLPQLLVDTGLASSNSEGRRLIAQGGVRIDGEPVASEEMPRGDLRGRVLQVGPRRFVKLT